MKICTHLFQFQSDQHVISLYYFEKITKQKDVENKHNYDEWGGFVLINCQILRTDGKENPQELVKEITCCNLGLKVHSNLKPFR